ncbi:MAG: serine hydroxymethyltransferase [Candidatus Woesearchaeota archaeon]
MNFDHLKQQDPEVYHIIVDEIERQNEGVELIASENLVSNSVLEATGSHLTNKYSEGYAGKRYYAGNEFIDKSEELAIARAKLLFGAEHVNVQPHAGSQANMEAYFALLNLKDKILGMKLDHGGHLTHGSPVNFSGKFYTFSSYGVDKETGRINYDEVAEIAQKEQPKLLLSGASAYPRTIDFKRFQKIAEEVGCYHMADIAHISGLIAAKLHPDPVSVCDVITTTTHKTLRGPRGAIIMSKKEDRLKPDGKKNLAQKIDSAVFPGMQGGPLDHVIAAKAVAFGEALKPAFPVYQKQVIVNAQAMAKTLLDKGITLVSGGTDNHLLLLDVSALGIGGKTAEKALETAGIYCNKNMIPHDSRSPFDPSGIRIGTPAMTTRGFKEDASQEIAEIISNVLHNPKDDDILTKSRKRVTELCKEYPIYKD